MNEDMERYRGLFVEEAREHLAALSDGLMALESGFEKKVVDGLFRAAHSMKGMSATLGFTAEAALAHAMEDQLARIRDMRSVAPGAVDVLLAGLDTLQGAVDAIGSGRPPPDPFAVTEMLRAFAPAPPETEVEIELETGPSTPAPVRFRGPDPDLAALTRLQHAHANLRPPRGCLAVRLSDTCLAPKARLLVIERTLKAFGEVTAVEPDRAEWGKIDVTTAPDIHFLVAGLADIDAAIQRVRTVPDVAHVAAVELGPPAPQNATAPNVTSATVRVPVDRIDALLDRAGELRIAQAQLDRLLDDHFVARRPYALTEALARIHRELKDIHSAALELRTLPVSLITGRFTRLVRDTAQRLGKKVRLVLEGEDTQVDRSVLEELADPIMHLVKNALGHGVERPPDRVAVRKPEEATVTIAFRRVPTGIEVEVRDDGKGIDRARVVERAVEAGHLPEGTRADTLADADIMALLTRPGFSTAEEVTDVSGRGVGLDVVQARLNAIGGSIRIASTDGQGTAVRLSLPPTLALIEALECTLDGDPFYVPMEAIVTGLTLRPEDLGRGAAKYRDPRETPPAPDGKGKENAPALPPERDVALVDLDGLFGISERRVPYRSVATPGLRGAEWKAVPVATPALVDRPRFGIIVERHGHRACLVVESLGTIQELVVKGVDLPHGAPRYVSGATIRGDGRVGLVLDVPSVLGATLARKPPLVARP